MYFGIKHKKKICKGCGYPKCIFSHGLCIDCHKKANFKPLRRTKLKSRSTTTTESKMNLSQTETFYRAFKYWNGLNFLTGEKEELGKLETDNFHHLLPKGRYKYFKYYAKCVVIIPTDAHFILTHGRLEDIAKRIREHPEENWSKFNDFIIVLKLEYQEWIKNHKNEYKI